MLTVPVRSRARDCAGMLDVARGDIGGEAVDGVVGDLDRLVLVGVGA